MSSSDGSLAYSSSEDTDVDVADKDLEVEGSPNSSAQGSNQEAVLRRKDTNFNVVFSQPSPDILLHQF